MRGRIDAQALHRLAYNALLYSDRSCILRGTSLWVLGGATLRVVASDEYFILSDQADCVEVEGPSYWLVELADLKLLEKTLRDETGVFDLSEIPGALAQKDDDIYEMLAFADESIWEAEKYEEYGSIFSVHPNRLRKLSLIKPGDVAIELRLLQASGDGLRGLVSFRMGDTVRGLIAPLS